jgi:hypothetical protein
MERRVHLRGRGFFINSSYQDMCSFFILRKKISGFSEIWNLSTRRHEVASKNRVVFVVTVGILGYSGISSMLKRHSTCLHVRSPYRHRRLHCFGMDRAEAAFVLDFGGMIVLSQKWLLERWCSGSAKTDVKERHWRSRKANDSNRYFSLVATSNAFK